MRHKLRHNNYIAPALQKCQNKPSALLIACITDGYFWSIFASMIGVVCVNFLFTYPYWALNFTLADYPVTFIGMLAIFFITSAAATHMKQQMEIPAERERLLAEAEKEKMRADLLRAISHDLRPPDKYHRLRRILFGKRSFPPAPRSREKYSLLTAAQTIILPGLSLLPN